MTSNDTGFAEMEDIGMAQNLSDSVCEPVPASICKGHPYMCLCKQEKDMLQEIWRNSTSTAALYVCGILFLYFLGLFLLLIHSIRQRTEQITCYDVYMELCDVGYFIQSFFRSTNNKQPAENKLRPKGSTRRQNPQCPDIVSDINEEDKDSSNDADDADEEEENVENTEFRRGRYRANLKRLSYDDNSQQEPRLPTTVLWKNSNGRESVTIVCQSSIETKASLELPGEEIEI